MRPGDTAPDRALRTPSEARRLSRSQSRANNLERRFVPAGGGCNAWQNFDDIGTTTIEIVTPSGCSADVSEPDASITGRAWSPCDSTIADVTAMISGHLRVIFTDPGSSAPGDCSDADYFDYYQVVPPWSMDPHGPMTLLPFGYGITYQAATRTALPAWLVFNPTISDGWAVMVAGTELSQPNGLGDSPAAGWNMARPDYPFNYAADDALFIGSFMYLPTVTG